VHTRDERRVDDEVGARGAADGLDRAGGEPEGPLRTLKNPHIPTIYPSSAKIQTPSIAAAAAEGPSWAPRSRLW
jgi:hypothetical protein